MAKTFLQSGNGHQLANRRKAMAFALVNLEGASAVDDATLDFPPYGRCRFAAYTDEEGAMISTPGRDDNAFGSQAWHHLDKIMMFRDFGDGRCAIYICPIKPLFSMRTIGHHGVRWPDIQKLSDTIKVYRPA
ncbi:MAG: hypothetical protein A2790_20190 [Phenylobacterium sp. RIFCSPHIGHO2_01_FULL_69_31]|uniref:hypothetical protein n=1 Tax=Phenylobacterium sp. RIFCSPHIGHO2_01_FULL_69_31 TaxID=1801944 RepID=UPI0008C20D6B|nr:hypothetical protein [Phenylobacterium sp. RIFCSPHIGHO2_01_FULL_69_31]OHB26286.1 MAG: hypothetical protein A2790_20190 [Phenylobacterium sp. RIFCSPHIGHO2_01_FULL_69_31]